jgi:predicted RNase H-like nuclease (RuvC/YqgF family)
MKKSSRNREPQDKNHVETLEHSLKQLQKEIREIKKNRAKKEGQLKKELRKMKEVEADRETITKLEQDCNSFFLSQADEETEKPKIKRNLKCRKCDSKNTTLIEVSGKTIVLCNECRARYTVDTK